MTREELNEFIQNHPVLYHVAEGGSWPSIRRHGLLSTTALLDLYNKKGEERENIESRRRIVFVEIDSSKLVPVVIRDQKPLSDATLINALDDGLTPTDWYLLLNGKTFFCLTKSSLNIFLCAGTYAAKYHDVLTVNTESLIRKHWEKVKLSPINSGYSVPFCQKRGTYTFKKLEEYPYVDPNKRSLNVISELVVDYAVPDIEDHVLRVDSIPCRKSAGPIWGGIVKSW